MAEAAAAARAMAAPWSLPARLGAGARARLTSWSIAATLAALGAATRLPLGGRYLFDWDSLQFALGMRRFDLAAHRPHPPGYVGYVAAGKVLAGLLGGDANRGLVWLSGVAEAATIAGIFLVAERLWGRFAGLAAAALMLSSPLFWMYGETALTYGLEPGLALLGFWLVWRAVGAGGRGLAVAALVIGLVGAIRPSTEFFLLPLLALGVWLAGHDQASPPWPGRPAARLLSVVGGLAAGTLVWLVPLLALSGGPVAYLAASAALAHRVSGGSAIWRAGSGGLLLDARAVFDGLAYSLGLYLPLAAGALVAARLAPARWPAPGGGGRRFGRPGTARTRRPVPLGTAETRRPVPLGTAGTRRLVLLGTAWALPALLTYLLVHIGELAYVLYLVPLLVLPAGLALDRVAGVLAGARPGWRPRLRAGLMAACVAVNAATFVLPDGSLLGQVGARDRHVAAVLAAVRRYATADVVVIADPEGPSSYRTAMYYLPEYTVVAVGRDRFGRAGEMFSNRPGAPEYDLARFDHVGPLRLPAGRVALILDPVVLDSVADPERLEPMRPAGDPAAVIYSVWLDPADPPRARGSWIWLRASDTLAHPVRA